MKNKKTTIAINILLVAIVFGGLNHYFPIFNKEVVVATNNEVDNKLASLKKENMVASKPEEDVEVKDTTNKIEEEKKEEETKVSVEETQKEPVLTKNQLLIKNKVINYVQEGGQSAIDKDHNIATTQGGRFVIGDELATYFGGHDDGPMGVVAELKENDIVKVSDDEGNIGTYKIVALRDIPLIYDQYGGGYTENLDDINFIDAVLKTKGEKIALQTCIAYYQGGYTVRFVYGVGI